MARYKTYDYRQRVLLPVSLEDQLMPGTLEFAIHTLVEKRLDLSIFDGKYRNDETGRAAYDPKILLFDSFAIYHLPRLHKKIRQPYPC